MVYAKCDEQLRTILWKDLRATTSKVVWSLGIVGDSNVITNAEEKQGGRPFRSKESFDFLSCLSNCDLQDGGYVGSAVTIGTPNTMEKIGLIGL